jgi:hypothetical protein
MILDRLHKFAESEKLQILLVNHNISFRLHAIDYTTLIFVFRMNLGFRLINLCNL